MFPFSPIPRTASFHPPFFLLSLSRHVKQLRYHGTRANCHYKKTVMVSLNNGASCRKDLYPQGFQTTWVTGQLHKLGPYQPFGPRSGQEAKNNCPRLRQPLHWRARVTYVLKSRPKNTKVLRHSDESKHRTAAKRYLQTPPEREKQRRILSQL